jgi:hypothetical protein
LCGLLGSTGMLASRLAGLLMITRILGIPEWLNLDRSWWNRSCKVSSSSSSEVSSMVMTSYLHRLRGAPLPCLSPLPAHLPATGGEGGFETNFTTSSYNKYHL